MKTFMKSILFICLFSYSLEGFSRTIVISDIDDTIKKANSMGLIAGAYHFFLKKPYLEMRDLFIEIKKNEESQGQEVKFFYVSAAFDFTFKAQIWLNNQKFPEGEIALRTFKLRDPTYTFKYAEIKKILTAELKNDPDLKVYFFGDNSDQDAIVYSDVIRDFKLKNAYAFVRDVSTEATFFDKTLDVKKIPGVNYFFSEKELLNHDALMFMSMGLRDLINSSYLKKTLVPDYTKLTLARRVRDLCLRKTAGIWPSYQDIQRCKDEGDNTAARYWNEYYRKL
jgi:Uncharacterized conserved protein (DUF2183)